jgi:glycosyltransferase involved in cell wall biosynthesis
MRILLLSHGYAPTVSGVTIVVQKLARALVEQGHQVAVLTASDVKRPYRADDDGVQLIRVRSIHNPIWSEGPIPALTSRTLGRTVAEFRPDVIHTHENFIMAIQLVRLRRRLGVPMVISCHALPDFVAQFLPQTARLDRGAVRFVWHYMITLLNRFDAAVFPTRTHRDLFLDQGLRAGSVIISNGVDAGRFHPANGRAEDVDRRYHLPAGQRILFVGRLCRDKNLETLIRAMPEIWARRQAHLLLVGRGDHRPELEALVQDLGLQACIHFLGYVPKSDLPAIYRASDLFAITSKVEVQSIPTLQALVTGLPVVAADSGALPELVRSHVNGYLAPAIDAPAIGRAVLNILDAPGRIEQFGQASITIGRRHEETFTFKAFMELYQQLVVSRWKWTPEPIWSEERVTSNTPRQAPL